MPRGEVYARGLRHRCVFVFVRDAEDRIFVHRRTAGKLVFPSLYDMFVGGVVGAGEEYDDAALREAEEELGVTGLPRPEPLFSSCTRTATAAHLVVRIYEVRCELPVSPQAGGDRLACLRDRGGDGGAGFPSGSGCRTVWRPTAGCGTSAPMRYAVANTRPRSRA